MGIGVLPSIIVLTAPSHAHIYAHHNKFSNICQQAQSRNASWCCFCISKYGSRADGSQWESRSAGTHKQQSRYPHDEFSTEDNGVDEAEHSGFKSSVKQRIWWSEDSSWDMDEDDDEDYDVIETGFGVFDGSFGFSSIFKVLRGFGWMIPAVVISMLLGTGSDTFFMALVLPLAQSALSMAFDALWGTSTGSMRPKTRSQKRGFRGTARRSDMKRRRERNRQAAKSTDDYKSWVAANSGAAEAGEGKKRSFGGWDDLDKNWSNEDIPTPSPADEKRQFIEGKLSKRGRNRSKPLLVRMLVALFPFLGIWTKIL